MSVVENWARTFQATPGIVRYVDTVEQIAAGLAAAKESGAALRMLGAAQSPSDIALSGEHQLVVRGLKRIRSIDRERCEVVAEGGITLGELSKALDAKGLALPNLGSISRQTLGGAAATGTHGTGVAWGSVPTWIEEFELLTVEGSLLSASPRQNSELFAGGRLSLGALGVQTAFRLKVVPAFDLRVEEGPVRLQTAMDAAWYGGADHARVWYLPHVGHAWGWRAWRVPPGTGGEPKGKRGGLWSWVRDRALGYYGFEAGLRFAISFPGLLPGVNRAYSRVFLDQPRQTVGGSLEQFTFDCLFHQRVNEWAVAVPVAEQAALGIRATAERGGFAAHLPVEIRWTAGDDLWLSPTYGQARCWIGVVAYLPYGREPEWRPWFDAVEAQMQALGGRPHWAKQFTAGPAALRAAYPQWDAFARLRARMDPERRLRNPYTVRVLGE